MPTATDEDAVVSRTLEVNTPLLVCNIALDAMACLFASRSGAI